MTMNGQVWWYLARAAGITAWACATASVLWGMALSTRALGSKPSAPWLTDLHRYLGGLTLAAVGAHLLGLWADSFVSFGPRELFVPLASDWRPWPVALGILALYGLLAVEVTSLLRRRMSRAWWRRVHLTAYLVWAMTTLHLLLAGTDAANPVLVGAVWTSTVTIVFFTIYLVVGPPRAKRRARAARQATADAAPPEPVGSYSSVA